MARVASLLFRLAMGPAVPLKNSSLDARGALGQQDILELDRDLGSCKSPLWSVV